MKERNPNSEQGKGMAIIILIITVSICMVVIAAIVKDFTVGLSNPQGYEKILHSLIAIISIYIGSKIRR